jgi:Zn-dependent peptidase ImmA (M78 family)/transcriptional regulator with XRE-family HTH domain
MKQGVTTFVPARLSQAREASGFNKGELAEALGVSSEALRSYEQGLARPMPERIAQMASVLNFPERFFSMPTIKQGNLHIFWRDRRTVNKASRNSIAERVRWACEVFYVLDEYVEFPCLDLPKLDLPRHWRDISNEDIERAAEKCRSDWGLGDFPIPDMTLALENIGVPVFAFEVANDQQFGFAHYDAEVTGRPIVAHNVRNSTCAKSRFNIAHEFGHIMLHASVTPEDQDSRESYWEVERQANRFAAALLFPRTAFFREVRFASIGVFASLKRDWNIPIATQVYRSFDLGLITQVQKDAFLAALGRKGYYKAGGEPYDDVFPIEKPRMLRRAVDAIEAGSLVHLQVLEQRLPLPKEEVRAILSRDFEPSSSNVVQLRRVR